MSKKMKPINVAAIDIGSNGARLLIKRFDPDNAIENERIRKMMFIRIPLRLGKDVFSLNKISKERTKMMMHMMKGFKDFMKLYNVKLYRACATSAMRDAENGKEVMKKIEKATGIELEIIRGQEEARLLFNNLLEKTGSNKANFAYIDVGGGSTEVSLIHDGELAESYSYNIGTLRMLSGKVKEDTVKLFMENLSKYATLYEDIQIIGSGGNINKLCKLARHSKEELNVITLTELNRLHKLLQPMSIEERKTEFGLKDDRADVIVPAAEIFLKACQYLKCNSILVPNISLADSIVDGLMAKQKEKSED